MAGTLLSVGVVVCTATLSVGLVSAAGASVFSQKIAGVADAAALAAADAASGLVAGEPCERAGEVAASAAAALSSCELDGLVATVTVSAGYGRMVATASARAGPPG